MECNGASNNARITSLMPSNDRHKKSPYIIHYLIRKGTFTSFASLATFYLPYTVYVTEKMTFIAWARVIIALHLHDTSDFLN